MSYAKHYICLFLENKYAPIVKKDKKCISRKNSSSS